MTRSIVALVLLVPLVSVVLPVCLYLASLSIAALFSKGRRAPHGRGALRRFAVLVPAHDEATVIGRLLESIRALDYPADRVDAWVVADNCIDATALIADAHGAIVRERQDSTRRGKGHALQWLLEVIRREGQEY